MNRSVLDYSISNVGFNMVVETAPYDGQLTYCIKATRLVLCTTVQTVLCVSVHGVRLICSKLCGSNMYFLTWQFKNYLTAYYASWVSSGILSVRSGTTHQYSHGTLDIHKYQEILHKITFWKHQPYLYATTKATPWAAVQSTSHQIIEDWS